jgi:hopene-associated glycosyltransferase HpnB
VTALALIAALWIGFALFDRRWRIEPRLREADGAGGGQRVVAVVPARNEAAELPRTLGALLSQRELPLEVVLVDDHSEDGTGEVARRIAAELGAAERLTVITPPPLPPGWAGKVWAQHHGVTEALRRRPDWIWLSDADIRHAPDVLGRLLATARLEGRDFVSVMARLRCETKWERLLVPAFTYFFAALYPFSRIRHDGSSVAGAAGGCVLVRRDLMERIGGMEAIRDAVIDDVAFGRACKRAGGRLWLGYDAGVDSTRGYDDLDGIWNMVARSAYTQLHYNPLLLAGCVAGLGFIFFVPVLAALFAGGAARALGLIAYAAMVRTYMPMNVFLGAGRRWAFALPVAAALYTAMTVSSGWRHHFGHGAAWKGRRLHA